LQVKQDELFRKSRQVIAYSAASAGTSAIPIEDSAATKEGENAKELAAPKLRKAHRAVSELLGSLTDCEETHMTAPVKGHIRLKTVIATHARGVYLAAIASGSNGHYYQNGYLQASRKFPK
jgi:hypothetical protein